MIDDPVSNPDHVVHHERDENPYSAPPVDPEEQAQRDAERRELRQGVFAMLLLIATAVTASVALFLAAGYRVGEGLWKHDSHPPPGVWFLPAMFVVPVGLFIATMGVVHFNRRGLRGGLVLVAGAIVVLMFELIGMLWLRR